MDKAQKLKDIPKKIKIFWKTPPEGRHLNLKEILCLAGGSMGISFIINVLALTLTASQISEIYQIDVLHGPAIVLISSVLSLIAQPFFGKLLQNTNTRWGRYKPYLLFLAPVIGALGIAATWLPQGLDEQARTIYAYVTCTPSLLLWGIWQNTFNMLPAVITPNQQERTDIWSPIGLVLGFAPTVLNFIKGFIRGYYIRQGMEFMAFRVMGLISVAMGLALVFLILKVKERIIQTAENNERIKMSEGLRLVMKNKPLMVLTLALLLGCMRECVGMDAEIMGRLRFASTIDRGGEIFSSLTLIIGFAATPNMILLPLFTRKFNNKTILMFWASLNAVSYIILAIIGVQNIPQGATSAVVITIMRFIALFNATGSLLPLMLSELFDYQQYISGKRLEGFIQIFAYSIVGLFANLANFALSFVKQALGYQPKNYFNVQTVSEELMNAATNYYNVAFLVSGISAALMFLVLIFYGLTKKKHAEAVNALTEQSGGELSNN